MCFHRDIYLSLMWVFVFTLCFLENRMCLSYTGLPDRWCRRLLCHRPRNLRESKMARRVTSSAGCVEGIMLNMLVTRHHVKNVSYEVTLLCPVQVLNYLMSSPCMTHTHNIVANWRLQNFNPRCLRFYAIWLLVFDRAFIPREFRYCIHYFVFTKLHLFLQLVRARMIF